MSDLISRQAAIDALGERPMVWVESDYELGARNQYDADVLALETVPSAQPEPSEITDEQAILHLQSIGWMQNHDREMYESGLRERLADDSEDYNSLIPCEDTISRQVAIDGGSGT